MANFVSQRVDRFLGLNNLLNPASNEYREGMAYRAKDVRMDRTGVWVARPKLSATAGAPGLLSAWGSGLHFKNLAVQGTDKIIQTIATTESLDIGSNEILYGVYDQSTGSITAFASGSNTTVTSASHGLSNGAYVKIIGTTSYNGTHLVSGVTTHTYDIPATYVADDATGTWGMAVVRQLAAGTKTGVAAPTNPTVTQAPTDLDSDLTAGTPTRQENGTYFYIFTSYNDTYKHESIPAKAYQIDLADNSAEPVRMKLTANDDGDDIRVYRTMRTSATDGVFSPNNRFYYVGTATTTVTFVDRLNDSEIVNNEYEARGSTPPEAVDYLKSWNNRMYYFKGNIVYWSSAGRPQEVAQEFNLSIETTEGGDAQSVKVKPKLSIGQYGEAKFEISQLASKTVTGAMERDGRLWIFTNNTVGYLIPTNQLEGVRYKEYRRGIGLVNDKCLITTPYGIFGADRQGMWHLNHWNELKRITDGNIDLLGGADTTITQSYVTNSFLLWVPVLNEVWWSMQYAATPTYIQIVYQADRGIFTGPYTHAITGGCNYDSTSGTYAYVTGPYMVDQTTADSQAGYLDFWFGQHQPGDVKDNLKIQVVHSATPGAAVSASIYQNDIASTTSITADTTSYETTVGHLTGNRQGKMFKLALTLPAEGAALSVINYKYNAVGFIWAETFQ